MKQLAKITFLFLLFAGYVMAEENPVWIDVRSAEEFAGGHLDNAVNIPHTEITGKIADVTTDKDAEIHLYCGSGKRAGIAREALEELGYTNVTNEGGYKDIKERMLNQP